MEQAAIVSMIPEAVIKFKRPYIFVCFIISINPEFIDAKQVVQALDSARNMSSFRLTDIHLG
jgi:hypothetical protein